MYNFSGVWYRIWWVCGAVFLLGGLCILLEKPWANGFRLRNCKLGIIIIAFATFLSLVYAYRIISPKVSSHTGEYVGCQRNSRVAPPLPVTYEYVFGDSKGKRKPFYLDVFSKKAIFPYEFKNGQVYTIYFDEFTKIILKVEEHKTG